MVLLTSPIRTYHVNNTLYDVDRAYALSDDINYKSVVSTEEWTIQKRVEEVQSSVVQFDKEENHIE